MPSIWLEEVRQLPVRLSYRFLEKRLRIVVRLALYAYVEILTPARTLKRYTPSPVTFTVTALRELYQPIYSVVAYNVIP